MITGSVTSPPHFGLRSYGYEAQGRQELEAAHVARDTPIGIELVPEYWPPIEQRLERLTP